MKKVFIKSSNYILTFIILLTGLISTAWAELPKPPDSDMASGNKGWLDIGKTQIGKTISIAALALGAIILVGVAANILRAYQVSNEKGELGHFFKMLIVGLLVAAIGIGLVYAGYQIFNV